MRLLIGKWSIAIKRDAAWYRAQTKSAPTNKKCNPIYSSELSVELYNEQRAKELTKFVMKPWQKKPIK